MQNNIIKIRNFSNQGQQRATFEKLKQMKVIQQIESENKEILIKFATKELVQQCLQLPKQQIQTIETDDHKNLDEYEFIGEEQPLNKIQQIKLEESCIPEISEIFEISQFCRVNDLDLNVSEFNSPQKTEKTEQLDFVKKKPDDDLIHSLIFNFNYFMFVLILWIIVFTLSNKIC